jgi:hypothetical protein
MENIFSRNFWLFLAMLFLISGFVNLYASYRWFQIGAILKDYRRLKEKEESE